MRLLVWASLLEIPLLTECMVAVSDFSTGIICFYINVKIPFLFPADHLFYSTTGLHAYLTKAYIAGGSHEERATYCSAHFK